MHGTHTWSSSQSTSNKEEYHLKSGNCRDGTGLLTCIQGSKHGHQYSDPFLIRVWVRVMDKYGLSQVQIHGYFHLKTQMWDANGEFSPMNRSCIVQHMLFIRKAAVLTCYPEFELWVRHPFFPFVCEF